VGLTLMVSVLAFLGIAGKAMAANPPSLQGESFGADPASYQTTCNPGANSTISWSLTGTAFGPYPGTFTETGTTTIGPQTEVGLPNTFGQNAGPFISAHASFTINSPAGQVSGTKDLQQAPPNTLF